MKNLVVLFWLALLPSVVSADGSVAGSASGSASGSVASTNDPAECGGTDLLAQMPPEKRARITKDAAAYPYPTGLLWRATKGAHEITLFGTYHLAHRNTSAHFDALLSYATAADIVYFEMSAPDTVRFQTASASNPDVLFVNTGPTLPDRLTPPEWDLLKSKMAARGFPGFMTAKFKPIFITMMLGMSPCKIAASAGNGGKAKGTDFRLARHLDDIGHDARSIEDYMALMDVLNAFTPDEQIEMLRLSLNYSIDPDDMMKTMERAYNAQNIAMVWEFGRALSLEHGGPTAAADFAKLEDIILTKRNLSWIDVMQQTPDKSLFVAVGAAHLTGENGVLRLLSARGYDITRLPFDIP